MPKCAPAASDDPFGDCLERGIITYLPLIAASMAIQPSVLPAARLSAALPLERKRGESRFDAVSLDDMLVNPKRRLCDPRASPMNGRVCSHSWIAPSHAH